MAIVFFRRFRKRRAEKAKAKKELAEKIARVSSVKGQAIFRGRCGGSRGEIVVDDDEMCLLYNSNTAAPTEDEDDSTMNPSPTGRLLTLEYADTLLSKQRYHNEILDLQKEINQLKVLHEEDLTVKDMELFNNFVEIGFVKEDMQKALNDLEDLNQALYKKDEALQVTLVRLHEKEDELNQTINDLEESREILAALSAELDESKRTIQSKDATIEGLEKSLKHGKRGAQVVMGLLTLGALCSDDH